MYDALIFLHRHVCIGQQGQNTLCADCSMSLDEDRLKGSPDLSKEVGKKKNSFIQFMLGHLYGKHMANKYWGDA